MPQLRFLFASKPDVMSKALGIVYRTIATHLIHTAGHTHDTAHAGAITFIQRFGSALNLNVHLMCRDARMSRAHGCAGATMARLAALVPKPRINLTRYHGVFAPNNAQRAAITPSQRGKGGKKDAGTVTTAELLDDKSYIQ